MTNDELEALFNRFDELQLEQKELHLEQQQIVSLIKEEYKRKSQEQTDNVAQVSPRSTTSTSEKEPTKKIIVEGFQVYDRVRIINKVKKQGDRPVDQKDRLATVTGFNFSNGRINILTDNGTKTWRLAHNLKRISNHE